ncbi:MAG: ECF transporter S component [Chloroflexi bacterium]|jgi:uncharacterized membrane protein|nr:ECF transporter S component [Chloroflexota bacterium]
MKNPTMRMALLAIMIAVTTVFTVIPKIPIPGTEGYLNLSDVAITFAGVAFGPIVGLVAGGVGTALADFMGGYGQWAGISLLAHGLEGFLIGVFARQGRRWSAVLGWAVGALFMVIAYYAGEALVFTGWKPALVGVPFNLLQGVVGGLVGLPLYYAVARAYPAIAQLRDPGGWREE